MINSIINFATTTVSLIVFCIMGVYGAVDAVQYNDIVAFEGDVMWSSPRARGCFSFVRDRCDEAGNGFAISTNP